MTIANTFASKLFVGVVAIAMALSMVAPAQAQTEEELQAQIDQLMATINALQSQLGQTSGEMMASGSSVCPYAWTRSLSSGSTGADVMALQQFLNGSADTQVAAAGNVGSAGMETQYYGPATAAAVSNFQVKYRDSILTPVGLVNPTGYFGPSTMAKANALCATAPAMDDDSDDDDDSMTDGDVADLQGEGTLRTSSTDFDDDESEVQEGAEDVVVAVLTLEAEDGDILVDRLDFSLVADGVDNDEDDPWDVFDEVSLWVDGDKIADFESDDEDNYLDEDNGTFRFSKMGLIIEEDEEVEIEVAVSVANSVDGSDTDGNADWDIDVTDIRYFDADDVATNDTITVTEVNFDIVEEGTDDGASIESSSDDPDSTVLLVDDGNDDSDEYVIHIFDIEVDDDSSDLEVGDVDVDITITNPSSAGGAITADDVIDSVFLTIDGETVEGDAPAGTSDGQLDHSIAATDDTNTITYTFEFDQDVVLEGDTDYEVEVSIVFKGQDSDTNYENGVLVQSSVTGSTWEVEGLANDDELTGSDTGQEHTLANVVAIISDTSFEVDRNEAGDAGTISFEFTIEADGDNNIDFNVANKSEVDGSSDDIRFTVTGTDLTIATGTISLLSGDATSDGSGWIINDGDEATFVLDVNFTTVTSADNGTYRVTIDSIEGLEVDETSGGLNLTN